MAADDADMLEAICHRSEIVEAENADLRKYLERLGHAAFLALLKIKKTGATWREEYTILEEVLAEYTAGKPEYRTK